MSNWPNGGDYLEAMQHPARFLRDPRLQAYVAETDKWGRPKPSSGQFAIVCKLKNGTDEKAIKFFLYPQPKREGRYQAISDYLKERGRPTCLVDFHYDPRGVRIKTDWYPVQVMDWVRGVTLDKWVGQTVQAGDRQSLLRMAERWVKLLEELWGASICHGDLQHGNVMVVGDVPVLVDY
ncbi:MAG TPA: hypothetical protein VEL76_30045, partial [Gemmataceae bacterium]|nr:hypothetical protein [Gemmataceae bacterium]